MWLKFRNNKVEVELTLIVTRKQNCEQCCNAEDVPKTAQKPSMHQVFIDMLQVRILCPTPWEHRYIYVVQVPINVTMLPLVWFPVTVILVAFSFMQLHFLCSSSGKAAVSFPNRANVESLAVCLQVVQWNAVWTAPARCGCDCSSRLTRHHVVSLNFPAVVVIHNCMLSAVDVEYDGVILPLFQNPPY